MPLSTCTKCRTLVPLGESRCSAHRPKSKKSSASSRGYDSEHRRLRESWAPIVATGQVRCANPFCGKTILPGQKWHLGHESKALKTYRGPEHERCNTHTGAKFGR